MGTASRSGTGRRWAAWRAVAGLEWRLQWREPLTTLYALVFFLLAFGYTSSGAVELVGQRGDAPRHAPWALALATGGLVAFGQVITTLVVATALLRDEAGRLRDLLATTGLDARTWWSARVAAALAVMAAAYAAIPLGFAAGRLMPWVDPATLGPATLRTLLSPFVLLAIPSVAVVTAMLAATASEARRLLPVLAMALLLVGLWQLGLGLVAAAPTRTIGALLDPFATAPILAVTAGWGDAERAGRSVPWGGLIAANRALWMAIATLVALAAWRRARWGRPDATPALDVPADRVADAMPSAAMVRVDSALGAQARFTARWILRDGGWRAVMALALLNALANALFRPLPTPAVDPGVAATVAHAMPAASEVSRALLTLVAEHARLFMILLATVYAGELLWRERDLRVAPLMDALPVHTGTLVLGRVAGVLAALALLTLALAGVALVAAVLRGGAWPGAGVLVAWMLGTVFSPFAQLTLLSLAVHVLVDHKVRAHLLLITGWVAAVAVDRSLEVPWWLRVAEPFPLEGAGGAVPWSALVGRAAWWWGWGAACLAVAAWRWPRGDTPQGAAARRRLTARR